MAYIVIFKTLILRFLARVPASCKGSLFSGELQPAMFKAAFSHLGGGNFYSTTSLSPRLLRVLTRERLRYCSPLSFFFVLSVSSSNEWNEYLPPKIKVWYLYNWLMRKIITAIHVFLCLKIFILSVLISCFY